MKETNGYFLSETNSQPEIAPEKGWLQIRSFSFWGQKAYFQGRIVRF